LTARLGDGIEGGVGIRGRAATPAMVAGYLATPDQARRTLVKGGRRPSTKHQSPAAVLQQA
jgi:hypothetical protein